MRPLRSAALLACALAAAGCSGGDDDDGGGGSTTAETVEQTATTSAPATSTTLDPMEVEAPAGAAFYDPPESLGEGEPGDLIWAREIDAPAGARAWKVLYRAEAGSGEPIAVSGVVAAPDDPAPAGGRPVMTWAHGTSGTADQCAPSKSDDAHSVFALDAVVTRGWVGVATDYEGLGTPGLHPYLVGESEGRGVLDLVRAAAQIPEAGASRQAVIWGVSQGGHAALFAAQIAPDYAPGLDVAGVVAAAPPGDLVALGAVATSSPAYGGYVFMVGGGYEAAYGDVNLDQIVKPEVLAEIDVLERECSAGVFDFAVEHPDAFLAGPLDVDPWPRLLEENSPGNTKLVMPALVLQGEDDATVPIGLTDGLVDRMCALGDTVDYRTFSATGHGQEIGDNFPAAIEWAAARFAGDAAASTCGQ